MKYIASCSFGKDSIAAIITRLEHIEPVDLAVYCHIMFDDETSAELPEHKDWIFNTAIPLLKSRFGIETVVLEPEHTYCDWFYREIKNGKNKGRIYGFPIIRGPWCNSKLKTVTIDRYIAKQGKSTQIVGIAADETKRIEGARAKNFVLPLVDRKITEEMAFEKCRKSGLLSPAYDDTTKRLGCWFCHNQSIGELRKLRQKHPDLWSKMLKLDRDSSVTFKPAATIADFDKRFEWEDRQIKIEME